MEYNGIPNKPRDMRSFFGCRASSATCTFLKKNNLSHIWGQETARLSATTIWAQWFEHYQKGRVRDGTIWIASELPRHLLLLVFCDRKTSLQALFFSYCPSVILVISFSHQKWLEVLTMFPVYDMSLRHVLLSTESYSKLIPSGPQSRFSLILTFSPSLKFKRCNV